MLKPETAQELYGMFKADVASWLGMHRQYSQQYVTLITVILAASLGALYQFGDNPWLALGVSVGPLLNILLCFNAISVCDRYYRHFLECITIQAKLEPLLGLWHSRLDVPGTDSTHLPFPDDDQILPVRWLESRQWSQAAVFVKENMRSGVNRLVRMTMLILFALNAVLFLGILLSVGIALF